MPRSESSSASGNGIGFFTVLFLILLTLKLTDYIDWSWWWIFAPLWGPFALILVILAVALVLVKDR